MPLAEDSIIARWKRLPRGVKWPSMVIAGWFVLVLLIQLFGSFAAPTERPDECPDDSINCVRLAHDGSSFRSGDLKPLSFNASRDEVVEAVEQWFDERWFATVISVEEEDLVSYVHGVDNTEFLFFPDDVYISVQCSAGSAEVTLHSQSRLGKGDMGENHRRVTELHDYLSSHDFNAEDDC